MKLSPLLLIGLSFVVLSLIQGGCSVAVRLPRASDSNNANSSSSTECATKEDIQQMLENERELLVRRLGNQYDYINRPIRSCSDLPQGYPTGYYWVENSTTAAAGRLRQVYCGNMTMVCGGDSDKKWTKVAHLDMTDGRQTCPTGFTERVTPSNKRVCEKTSLLPGCASVTFGYERKYTRVCGKIKAYQESHPKAFGRYIDRRPITTINDFYVDGVSLTTGKTPRQHIWSFAAAYSVKDILNKCSCDSQPDPNIVPPFVGKDFFCDTASQTGYEETMFENDPLWDGEGCEPGENDCCRYNRPPWFSKELSQTTDDDIEMRLCLSEHKDYGNVLIEALEIYVQ